MTDFFNAVNYAANEAMFMENILKAQTNCKIKKVHFLSVLLCCSICNLYTRGRQRPVELTLMVQDLKHLGCFSFTNITVESSLIYLLNAE